MKSGGTPGDQIIHLHLTLCDVSVRKAPDILNHPHPGIVGRDVVGVEETLRLDLCDATGEIVVRKICKEPTSTQIGCRRKIALSRGPQKS